MNGVQIRIQRLTHDTHANHWENICVAGTGTGAGAIIFAGAAVCRCRDGSSPLHGSKCTIVTNFFMNFNVWISFDSSLLLSSHLPLESCLACPSHQILSFVLIH